MLAAETGLLLLAWATDDVRRTLLLAALLGATGAQFAQGWLPWWGAHVAPRHSARRDVARTGLAVVLLADGAVAAWGGGLSLNPPPCPERVRSLRVMNAWLDGLSTLEVVLLVLTIVFGGSVASALLGGLLVRMGMRRPWAVRATSRLAYKALEAVKRPLTIVVLDEVVAVIRTGHYTKNISDALVENREELKALVAEKVRHDPNMRIPSRIPGYDTVVSEVSETVLRVVVDMLGDPRMDELVSDLLRNNLEQIRAAVRDREHLAVGDHPPPDPGAPQAQGTRAR